MRLSSDFKRKRQIWPWQSGSNGRFVSISFGVNKVNGPAGEFFRPVRIPFLATGTVLALLTACFPGGDPGSGCKGWDEVAFWKSATVKAVSRCLEAGSDPSVRQGADGWTPLHLAAAYNRNPAIIAALVAEGADPNVRGISAETPLHKAAAHTPTPAVIATLVVEGADPNAKDIYGETPLHEAAANNKNAAVIVALVEAGGDPKAKENSGETPLHKAARNNNPAVVNALLKAGAYINEPDQFGETPLHEAAAYTKTSAVINALLKAGADPSAKTREDRTPWDHAEHNEAIRNTAAYWRLKDRRE